MTEQVPSKLKIAIVLDRFLPSTGGQSYFVGLINELVRKGHDVHVFATRVEKHQPDNYTVHMIPVVKFSKILNTLSYTINSARILKKFHFDIVHQVNTGLSMNVFNPHGGVEKAYLKQEFASVDNLFYYVFKLIKLYLSPIHYLTIWLQKKQYEGKEVKKVIAISKMIKKHILNFYDVDEQKIDVVFNCVDTKKFNPENRQKYIHPVREVLGIEPNALLLMFAGHNYRLKGLKPLIYSLAILKNKFPEKTVRLIIIGKGRIAKYKSIAKRAGVPEMTIFLGITKNIEQYYAASDIYVHPTFYDSCSLTVLEAMASGLPAITTQFNGASDAILSDGGGKIINDPSNAQELADAIAYFFDEGRRNISRSVARGLVEKFTPEHNAEETLKVYYRALGYNL